MRINSNLTALVTYNCLNINEKMFAKSNNKLASGFKINVAGDDPAGYAISGRMRRQLDDLERCKTNATTGKSMCETADAALNDMGEIVQRLNELAVKSANGTLSGNDRQLIQDEIDQLKDELKRIAKTTELNAQVIFDGTFVDKGYTNNKDIQIYSYNEKAEVKEYNNVTISEEFNLGSATEAAKFTVVVEGFPEEYTPPEYNTPGDETSGIKTPASGNRVEMTFDYPIYMDDQKTTLSSDGQTSHPTAVVTGVYQDAEGRGSVKICEDGSQLLTVNAPNGESITFKIGTGLTKPEKKIETMSYKKVDEKGNYVKDDNGDFVIESKEVGVYDFSNFYVNGENSIDIDGDGTADKAIPKLNFNLTGEGSMRIQVGPNNEEYIKLTMPKMSLEAMDLDDIDLTTEKGATQAINKIKNALEFVAGTRSKVGAYQNRIEHSIEYLDSSNENLTATYSRILDTDMAEEMIRYTNAQILVQASTSILAQANREPQQALELLQ